MFLPRALIVDTASDLLLWSKGKHVLVSGVLYCTLELVDYLGVGLGDITGSGLASKVILLSIGSCFVNFLFVLQITRKPLPPLEL